MGATRGWAVEPAGPHAATSSVAIVAAVATALAIKRITSEGIGKMIDVDPLFSYLNNVGRRRQVPVVRIKCAHPANR